MQVEQSRHQETTAAVDDLPGGGRDIARRHFADAAVFDQHRAVLDQFVVFAIENQGVGQFQHVARSSFMWPGQFALLIQDAGARIFLNGEDPVTLRPCYPAPTGQTSMLRLRLP